jgi:hypothetical protein
MGFRSEKRVRLKAGVVPSIHAAPAAASGSATGGSEDRALSLARPPVRPPSLHPSSSSYVRDSVELYIL